MTARALIVAALLAVVAPTAQAAPTLVPLGAFAQPTYATAPASEPDRVFVTERAGRVRVIEGGVARTFLDVTAISRSTEGERGLLSMAFAPDYATSGRLYLYLTAKQPVGAIQIWEFRRSAADPGAADPATGRLLLSIAHDEAANHNGGQLQFGPDGRLWLATGDGGGSNNELGHAQDPSSLLGKLIRLDPAAPAPEIVARGLRNPWRFSFAPDGTIVIADVGQYSYEEIHVGLADNYGWPCREGMHDWQADPGCTGVALADPVLELSHTTGFCAIVGGYVVRDPGLPTLLGRYVYGDNCHPALRSLDLAAPASDAPVGLSVPGLSAFGEDACGRLLAVSLAGAVSRIVDGEATPCGGSSAPAPTPTPAPVPTPSATATPTPDARPCTVTARVTGLRSLKRRRYLNVALRSDEACRATITAARFRTARASLRPGVRRVVKLRRARRALPARVTVRVRAVDAAGNAGTITRRVRIRA